MNSEDARRKLQLLQRVKPENGFSEAEAENAVHLSLVLVKRFSIRTEEVRPTPAPSFALSWVYWEHLADEYGLKLHRFGGRGNLALPGNRAAFIKLSTGEWWVQRTTPGGHERVARNWGVESLREYLARNRTRAPSFLKR